MHTSRRLRRVFSTFALACLLSALWGPTLSVHAAAPALVGPKANYLAIGDSLAFGYQPDLDWGDGYSTDFYHNLQSHGSQDYDNLACPGETSVTMINGGCPYSYLRKYPYIEPQLDAAVEYIQGHSGQVSPVTLDIGANDILPDINTSTCSIDTAKFASDLATLDANLKQTILPELHNALTVQGVLTGDLVLMNYYDPYQNICTNTVPYIETINQHLAADVNGYATIVDVFTKFGGAATPNPNICNYTWICSWYHDIHPKSQGYSVITSAFEEGTGY
ncbi:MAG TPA: SGNH/GDSL hydrolase family protein [Ktedonobacteraceae bacterium]|nr:SGNH/GDSL hydrolase family protein [Ktedonobacteraceae bacterium]